MWSLGQLAAVLGFEPWENDDSVDHQWTPWETYGHTIWL
jgi:hypothetical protein